jgi:hypothetical protein
MPVSSLSILNNVLLLFDRVLLRVPLHIRFGINGVLSNIVVRLQPMAHLRCVTLTLPNFSALVHALVQLGPGHV